MTPNDIQRSIDLLKQIEDRSGRANTSYVLYAAINARETIEDLRKDRERLESELCDAREAIHLVRGLIWMAYQTGFDPRCSDWADRLFRSQAVTLKALGADAPKPSDAIDEAMTQRGDG